MARTASALLAEIYRWLPDDHQAADPLFAALAGAGATAETGFDALVALTSVGGATGKWLTLLAAGYGVLRATAESDEHLRTRLRAVDDALTPVALLALVDLLISPDEAVLVEWFDSPYCDTDYADWATTLASGGANSFAVLIPDQGGPFEWGGYCDADAWCDSTYGGVGEPAIYRSIVAIIERARAAGVFWRLVLET